MGTSGNISCCRTVHMGNATKNLAQVSASNKLGNSMST